LAIPRHLACVAVAQFDLETVLNGPPAEEFDVEGSGFVDLISYDAEEGSTSVGLSYLLPRVYALLENGGWELIKGDGESIFHN
jgi:hypothetical protein